MRKVETKPKSNNDNIVKTLRQANYEDFKEDVDDLDDSVWGWDLRLLGRNLVA